MQFVLHLFKIPNLRIGILFQIENLILLVAPHHVDSCLQCRALFLLHEKRSVRAAEQPCRTGDHFEAVTGGLLAGVVDGQNADAVLVGKLLELADDLIITGVAVCLAADLTDFLHGVNDNESGVGMLAHEILKLLVQPISNFASSVCKVQPVGVVDAVHHEHTALDALKIIFQSEVQHRAGIDFVAPQGFAGADMIGNLCHQKRLADFRRTREDVRARVEQAVDNGRPALICGLVQLGHGDRVQVMRVCQPLHPTVDFIQTFRAVLKITVDFFLKSGYTVLS